VRHKQLATLTSVTLDSTPFCVWCFTKGVLTLHKLVVVTTDHVDMPTVYLLTILLRVIPREISKDLQRVITFGTLIDIFNQVIIVFGLGLEHSPSARSAPRTPTHHGNDASAMTTPSVFTVSEVLISSEPFHLIS